MRFALTVIAAVTTLLATAGGAPAQQKITIGGTPNTGPATAMVADVEGIFQKHGLDAAYTLITINPSIPPALVSGSLQIGIPTPTTFLQSIDGGLDLVINCRRCRQFQTHAAADHCAQGQRDQSGQGPRRQEIRSARS
jgi:ABC-type nitrate/sulfonate/bicarbonate transport system substrate-binding protein